MLHLFSELDLACTRRQCDHDETNVRRDDRFCDLKIIIVIKI